MPKRKRPTRVPTLFCRRRLSLSGVAPGANALNATQAATGHTVKRGGAPFVPMQQMGGLIRLDRNQGRMRRK